jgi:Putative glycosyl/glycerophosphate transferases involved in teichoic acid biosynthesis TagF/TagB/EpsJ/RodC
MSRLRIAAPLLLVPVFNAVLLAGATAPSLGLVLLGCVALLVCDEYVERVLHPGLIASLQRIGAGPGARAFVRQALVVFFLLRSGALSGTAEVVLVLAVVARHAALAAFLVLHRVLDERRLRRCETRNLGLPGDNLPPPPPAWLNDAGERLIAGTDVLLAIALAIAYFDGSYAWIVPAAVAGAVLACVPPAILFRFLLAIRPLPQGDALVAAARAAVRRLHPVVILHFSGGVESVYQVNMWLETMERLDQQVLVLLRERRYLDHLAPTRLPVLCVPYSIDLMNFSMPSARVALYIANVGKNIHLLREPALKSAFIGHGDSDKTASFNPYAKVYDEVWVAGEAGRQRYLRADVGVRDEAIVCVGRPQLDAIRRPEPRPDGAPFTVLYAPTWEGWTEDLQQSSLVPMGATLVRELLATQGVRVLFKPHPLTGTVDPAALAARDEIAGLLAAAGPQHVFVQSTTPLYDCFDESDALISDISSVVSDYLASEKPYFVSNNAGLPADEFRERNPSASAAYLIGPGGSGLTDGLADARGADSLRARRREVRTYLLGDPDTDAMHLFRRAVENLVEKSDARARYVAALRAAGEDAAPATAEPTDDAALAELAALAAGEPAAG